MFATKTVQVAVGVLIVLGVAAFFMLAMQVSGVSKMTGDATYTVSGNFQNIGGLKVRAPVRIAGVTIGRVTGIRYDEDIYEAVVDMAIITAYDRLPSDSSASILTAGLLGEQYVGLEPGGSETFLKQGDNIKLTQSALVLEQMIGQFLFDKAADGGASAKESGQGGAP